MENPARDARKRVLVVEDNPLLLELSRRVLEGTGAYVVRCECGAKLTLTGMREFQPDLVLLDVNLGGRSGLDLAVQIRRDEELASVPVAFITGLIDHLPPQVPVLKKPFSTDELTELVGRMTSGRMPAPSLHSSPRDRSATP